MKKRICIIGVGPSGITALKNLKDKDLEVVVYDRNLDVGGNWIFSESISHSSVFETIHPWIIVNYVKKKLHIHIIDKLIHLDIP